MSSTPASGPVSPKEQVEGFRKLVEALFSEARSGAERTVNDAAHRAIAILEESEKFSIRRSQEVLSAYQERSEIESRKEISKAEIDARMQLLKLKESYVESVFEEARRRLADLVRTPDYESMMLENIKSVSKIAAVDAICLSERDAKRLGVRKIREAAGRKIEVRKQPVGTGGFIAVSNDGKMSIDLTIENMLNSERERLRGRIADLLFRRDE